MAIITSIITGGSNNHETTSEEANAFATDFVDEGVVGTITNTSGVAPSTGAFAMNAQGTPDMTVAVTSGIAYVTATPTGQSSQTFRVDLNANQNVTISANSSGSTKYDWVYISIDADNAADSNTAADNVASLVTSRSSSASTDDGTPPTYGYCIGVVTVANGASSISDGSIADSRTETGVNPGYLDVQTDDIADDAVTPAKWTNPYCFRAYLNQAQDNPSSGDTVTLNAESYDVGSNYNTTTYKYVAPIDGIYHFDAAVTTAADDARLRVAIAVGGTTQGTGGESTKRGAAVSMDVQLSANDEVTLLVYVGTGTTDLVTGSSNTWMSGHLVHAT